jgi:hypothetical protein
VYFGLPGIEEELMRLEQGCMGFIFEIKFSSSLFSPTIDVLVL